MEELIRELKNKGVLRSKRIEEALRAFDRTDFVLEEEKGSAYLDTALPIGFGQTISQPYTVIFMLELLRMKEGMQILEVGYGSGWQTALLAHLVGERGKIFAMEIVPELCRFGEKNVQKYLELSKRVSFYCHSAAGKLPEIKVGFDRIIAAADVRNLPEAWRVSLKVDGVLVYPSTSSIFKETKVSETEFLKEEYPGFVFVPFVEK